MRRILYHLIRIIPLLAIATLAVWLTLDKWNDGRQFRAIVQGLVALMAIFTLGKWLYSGHFQPKSFSIFILRYKQWSFFKRDLLPFIAFTLIGMVCAVGIFAIKEPDTLRDPGFYFLMGGFIIILGISKMIVGYIKYCYKHD